MSTNKYLIKFTKHISALVFCVAVFSCFSNFILSAHAADSMKTTINRVEASIAPIARLIILISYVAGVGFTMAGVLQFKAHKDNPTQVPLSKPIVLICVGAVLLFLPNLMNTAGKSIFGVDSSTAPPDSINIDQIKPDAAN